MRLEVSDLSKAHKDQIENIQKELQDGLEHIAELQALKAQLKIEIATRDTQIEDLQSREGSLVSRLQEQDTHIREGNEQIEVLRDEVKSLKVSHEAEKLALQ